MSAGLLLGVDGGNSKTIAAIATESGEVVAVARGIGSDIYGRESPEVAMEELARVVRDAFIRARASASDLSHAAFSLAGADWPEDFAMLEREIVTRLGLTTRPLIVNDAMGALRSGTENWEGVAIACGTFNAIGARNRDGRLFHFGAWPDRVGGYDLGRQAIDAVFRTELGLGPETALAGEALRIYGLPDVAALLHAFTCLKDRIAQRDVQRMSPALMNQADAGDAVARAIVVAGGHTLAQQARVAAARVGLPIEGTSFVLTGGVFEHPSEILAAATMKGLQGGIFVREREAPVAGALLLAFDQSDQNVRSDLVARNVARALERLA